jgi:hypothetical protein
MTRDARTRLPNVALVMSLLIVATSCRRHDDETVQKPPPAPAVDHLAPGELVEGPLRAFELRLPVGLEIREAFASVVYAGGPVDPMKLANYVRSHVTGGSISVGAAATVFDQVTVPSNPKRPLRIRVDPMAQGHAARLEVRDVTPTPAVSAADDAERWRRVGMTPDGKLLDPAHLR